MDNNQNSFNPTVNSNTNNPNFQNNPSLNNNQPINNTGFFNNQVSAPAPAQNNANNVVLGETPNTNVPNQQQVILGSINNVTYADTIGDISKPSEEPAQTEQQSHSTGNNQFINVNNGYSETVLNDLNVDDSYNQIQKEYTNPEEYINDPKVQANIHPEQANKITVTQELKTVLMLVAVLLVFIFVMPYVVDFFRGIIYH